MRIAAMGLCTVAALVLGTRADAQPNLKSWYFAEGSTNAAFGFEEEILVGNPTGSAANLTLRFIPDDGSTPIVAQETVAPFSRKGILTRAIVGNKSGVALQVTSDVDVVVERSMYWGGGLFNFGAPYNTGAVNDLRAGHAVMGVNAPATRWAFAEGAADGPLGFQTYVLVSNPSTTDAATVQVRYLTNRGERVVDAASGTLLPGQRRTFFANAALTAALGARAQFDFAIDVQTDNGVPVVAERAMYWGPNLRGGHAATGVQPQSVWYFAEGVQGAPPINFDTYVLLFNPSETETIEVDVDFFGPNGLAKNVRKTLAPLTRDNVYAGEYPAELAGGDKAFSVRALNTLGKPFVAERAVYWRGYREGTATAGTSVSARKWGFAEGQEGGFAQFRNPGEADPKLFQTYYLLLNNTDTPVNVRAVFYVEPTGTETTGTGAEMTVFVPARSRKTLSPSEIPALHNRKFAAFFEADGEIIAERAVYWGNGFVGGHAGAGAVLPDSLPPLPPPAAPGAPALTSISPARGVPTGGTVVTLRGTGFGLIDSQAGRTTVNFGTTAVPPQNITVLDANTIQLVTPPSGRGVASIYVTTRGVPLELPSSFEFFDPFAAVGAPINTFDPNAGFNCTGGGRRCSVITSFEGVVRDMARRQPFDIANSCRAFGGNEKFMEDVVAELRIRTGTNRWALNIKRGNEGLSEDIVTYYYGPEGTDMRNSTQVFIIDIIGNHCNPANRSGATPAWIDQTSATLAARTIGRWTLGSMCSLARYRDARNPNTGEFLFPECR